MNNGWDIEGFRVQQDELLRTLAYHWGGVSNPSETIQPQTQLAASLRTLGDISRHQILW
jgi:hypothetical protein